jgi:hypothetical protein
MPDFEYDCCGIQAIYLSAEGKLESGALKHNRASVKDFPMFTCLLRLSKFEGDLPFWEIPLAKVSEELKRNPELGILDIEVAGVDEGVEALLERLNKNPKTFNNQDDLNAEPTEDIQEE